MDDLFMDECDHLMGVWKVCVKCEKAIPENKSGGEIYGCKCLGHRKCPVPRVRENHSCSLKFKQQMVTNYVKNTFCTDDVRGAYKTYMDTNFISILNEKNLSILTKEECNILMMCWRICYGCETKVDGSSKQSDKTVGYIYGCQCLVHPVRDCPVFYVRDCHSPSGCSLQLKTEVIINYVKNIYSTDNVRQAFKAYMEEELPCLVGQGPQVFFHSELAVKKQLGEGAQGVVDLVSTDVGLMAVKIFGNGSFSERELGNALKVSHHPNFTQVLGVLYRSAKEKQLKLSPIGYAMEYMPGGSVHDVIHCYCETDRINYGLADILDWTRQTASALDYLHKRRIIHRDVKPQNMLFNEDRSVLKLCDLGVSNNIQTLGTAVAGTMLYMAPEVMSLEERVPYTEKCDVYSLAVSIWEMYHRKSPVLAHNLFNDLALMKMVQEGKRPEIAPSCEAWLRKMIEKGWSADVSQRPSMEELHTFAVKQLEKRRPSTKKELV